MSLNQLEPQTLTMIATTLRQECYKRSLCLEVFAIQDFVDSIEPLERIMQNLR